VIVLSLFSNAKDLIKLVDHQVVASPRVFTSLTGGLNIVLVPLGLVESTLYKRIIDKLLKLMELDARIPV